MNEGELLRNVFSARSEALSLLAVLEAVRAGNVAVALELLEEQLDNSVLGMDAVARQASSPERERIVEALRLVRDYRGNYPRRAESEMAKREEATAAGLQRIQERVHRILDDTE